MGLDGVDGALAVPPLVERLAVREHLALEPPQDRDFPFVVLPHLTKGIQIPIA